MRMILITPKISAKIEYIETNIKFLRGLIKIYSFKSNNNYSIHKKRKKFRTSIASFIFLVIFTK